MQASSPSFILRGQSSLQFARWIASPTKFAKSANAASARATCVSGRRASAATVYLRCYPGGASASHCTATIFDTYRQMALDGLGTALILHLWRRMRQRTMRRVRYGAPHAWAWWHNYWLHDEAYQDGRGPWRTHIAEQLQNGLLGCSNASCVSGRTSVSKGPPVASCQDNSLQSHSVVRCKGPRARGQTCWMRHRLGIIPCSSTLHMKGTQVRLANRLAEPLCYKPKCMYDGSVGLVQSNMLMAWDLCKHPVGWRGPFLTSVLGFQHLGKPILTHPSQPYMS